MRHRNGRRKLGNSASHRRALLRSLATSLMLHEKFETTLPRAKELRSVAEKLVTAARNDTLASRKLASSYLFDDVAVKKLFTSIAPRFKDRNGGYTRVTKTGYRNGDAAEMAVIEFVVA
jgi:large subunit ribosomal protein L17